MRDAESLLGQVLSLDLKSIGPEDAEMILPTSSVQAVLEFIDFILEKQPAEAIKMIGDFVADGINLEQFAYDALEALRLLMILQVDPQTKNINTDYSAQAIKELRKTSAKISSLQLIKMIESLITRRCDIKSAPMPQLPLELFVIEYTCQEDMPLSSPPFQGGAGGGLPSIAIDTSATPSSLPLGKGERTTNTITQTIKETISSITHRSSSVKTTLEEIKSKWNDVIEEISKENHSLSFILKMSEIQTIDDNGLHISVPYSFHKDKIEENKTKKTIEKALENLFSERIFLHCEVAEIQTQTNNDNDLNKLAADFGGEVI